MSANPYNLNFSFTATTGLEPTPVLYDGNGDYVADAAIVTSFNRQTWYGYTLAIESGFQGYVGFVYGEDVLLAMFAINPSEFETLPTQGVGGIAYTLRVVDNNGRAIQGAAVWVTEDQEGTILKGGTLYSSEIGKVTFILSPGSYYVWRRHSGFTFNNPNLITVPEPS